MSTTTTKAPAKKRTTRTKAPTMSLREARAWAGALTDEQLAAALVEHVSATTTDGQNRMLAAEEERDRRGTRPVEPEAAAVVEEAAEDAELARLPVMSTGAEIEAWHAGSDGPRPVDPRPVAEVEAVAAIRAAMVTGADQDAWDRLPETVREERLKVLSPAHFYLRKNYGIPTEPAPEVPEGQVLMLEEIAEHRMAKRRNPARVWGTGREQARQATAWGYDGTTFPGVMAPDATPADWLAVQEEVKEADAAAKAAAAAARWTEGMKAFRTVTDHPAQWSTAEGADQTVCTFDGCGQARNLHADVPAHVPTEAEWAENGRRTKIAGETAKEASTRSVVAANNRRQAAKATEPKKAAEPRVVRPATAPAPAGLTLQLASQERALVYATLGRFAYRAFDSWGDLLAPWTPLAPVTLTADRWAKVEKALEEHHEWAGKAKTPNEDRLYNTRTLAARVRELLA